MSLNFEDPRNSIGLIIGRRFIASLSRVCSINKAAGFGEKSAPRGKFTWENSGEIGGLGTNGMRESERKTLTGRIIG